jgi:Fe-S cluster biosynthesis and repair protein YggX
MSRIIYCLKLQKELESLDSPPIPGPLGDKIYEHISKEAWKLWMGQQTILINENRLKMTESKDRAYLRTEMEKFLFGSLA